LAPFNSTISELSKTSSIQIYEKALFVQK